MSQRRLQRIMLVDDDPGHLALIGAILHGASYDVVAIQDPTTAATIARSERPDLILCDIGMAPLDGYGVLAALQSDPVTATRPVVFLTGHTGFSERVKAFRYGVVDYITKPVSRSTLLRRLAKLSDQLALREGLDVSAGSSVSEALERLQLESRTGILTLETSRGTRTIVVRAGQPEAGDVPPPALARRVAFQELDPAHPALGTPKAPRPPASLKRILVVEDDQDFRHLVCELLRSRDFTVFEASDGEVALSVALDRRPWLILTDVNLPGTDGLALLARLRAHPLLRHLPVVCLSALDSYEERYRGLQAGADDYFSKETPLPELILRVELLLRRFADLGGFQRDGTVLSGQLEAVGAIGVLQMLNQERISGTLEVRDGEALIEVQLAAGQILDVRFEGERGVPALTALIDWKRGKYELRRDERPGGTPLGGFSDLLLESCRLLDERRAASRAAWLAHPTGSSPGPGLSSTRLRSPRRDQG